MANHKRGRPKSRRAGCLMCKWHKDNAFKDTKAAQTMQERRAVSAEEDLSMAAEEYSWDELLEDVEDSRG